MLMKKGLSILERYFVQQQEQFGHQLFVESNSSISQIDVSQTQQETHVMSISPNGIIQNHCQYCMKAFTHVWNVDWVPHAIPLCLVRETPMLTS